MSASYFQSGGLCGMIVAMVTTQLLFNLAIVYQSVTNSDLPNFHKLDTYDDL